MSGISCVRSGTPEDSNLDASLYAGPAAAAAGISGGGGSSCFAAATPGGGGGITNLAASLQTGPAAAQAAGTDASPSEVPPTTTLPPVEAAE